MLLPFASILRKSNENLWSLPLVGSGLELRQAVSGLKTDLIIEFGGWGGVCHLSFVALPAVSLEPGTCTVRVRLTSLMVCEPLKAETLAHLSWVPGTVTGPG